MFLFRHLMEGFHKLKSLIILISQANIIKHLPFIWAHSLLFGVAYGWKNYIEASYIKELIQVRPKFKSFSIVASNYIILYVLMVLSTDNKKVQFFL